jgi:protein SCO1
MAKSKNFKKYTMLFVVLFLFPLTWVLVFGVFSKHNFNTLPYYGPRQLLTQNDGTTDTVYHQLPTFQFTNQNGNPWGNDSLKNKVWLASFYSTNSPYIEKITNRLLWPNFRYRDESDIIVVSFSTDTDHDTPEVLATYIEKTTEYNGFPGKWQFLTGDQAGIHTLMKEGFDLPLVDNTSALYLVDAEGYLRGRYDGNSEYAIRDAVEDIALLKKEMDEAVFKAKKLVK